MPHNHGGGCPKKGTPEYETWILTPEYKERIKKISERTRGNKNPFFRKRHTKEARRKNSVAHIGNSPGNKGKKYPLMSIARTGDKNPMFGIPSPRKGKHHTIKSREKMSKSHMGLQSGDKHPQWKGDNFPREYPPIFDELFKKRNRVRYGSACFFPGCRKTIEEEGRELSVHHYDYDKNSLNCVPLCNHHNLKVNYNVDEWEEYFILAVRMYLEWHGRGGWEIPVLD